MKNIKKVGENTKQKVDLGLFSNVTMNLMHKSRHVKRGLEKLCLILNDTYEVTEDNSLFLNKSSGQSL